MSNIKKCASCNTYTLEDACPACGDEARGAAPPQFSMPDRYAKYRREAKQ